MQTFGLVLCIPCTTPPGPVGITLHRAFERAYLPLIEALRASPAVKASMHWSGTLLEWMEDYAADHLRMLEQMVQSGQIEILGGLFGGGLLPALPERDVVGQIQRSFSWWRAHGDPKIRGAWLPHCAWDPAAARILGQMGLRFTVLEEHQLAPWGSLDGWCLTEREGSTLGLFGAEAALCRMVPDAPPEQILQALDQRARAGQRCLTLLVPGERFGAGIDASATRCFGGQRGWVRRFFSALTDNDHWLKLTDFATVLDRMRPSGRCYPPASISLPVAMAALGAGGGAFQQLQDRIQARDPALLPAAPFLRAGSWDGLLASHPELNRLHKKMLRTSVEVFRLKNTIRDRARRGLDVEALEHGLTDASAALFRAQHGSAYVVGTEVGAQDGGVRHEAYANLLRAEYAVWSALQDAGQLRVQQLDADSDGRLEMLIRTSRLGALIAPGQGAALLALDVWSLPGNLINVWGRREESFHADLQPGARLVRLNSPARAGADSADPDTGEDTDLGLEATSPFHLNEEGLHRRLWYDRGLRGCFQDRFLAAEATLETLQHGGFSDVGDFASGEYTLTDQDMHEQGASLTFEREGNVTEGVVIRLATLKKKYTFFKDQAAIRLRYEMSNPWHDPVRGRFAVELNLNLDSALGNGIGLEILHDPSLPGPLPPVRLLPPDQPGEHTGVREVSLVDSLRGMRVRIQVAAGPGAHDAPAQLWHYPVETVSRTPAGVGRLYQGCCLLLWWPVELWTRDQRAFELLLTVEG